MSARKRAALTGEAVTFADCAELSLEVVVSCSRCQCGRGVHPGRVAARFLQTPIRDLFTARKLRCGACGAPASDLEVTFQGTYVEPQRTILHVVER